MEIATQLLGSDDGPLDVAVTFSLLMPRGTNQSQSSQSECGHNQTRKIGATGHFGGEADASEEEHRDVDLWGPKLA